MRDPPTDAEERSKFNAIIRKLFHSYAEHESYMSEIQLRRIVDEMANEIASQGTDGDGIMQKGEETISKFRKGALEIGAAGNEAILEKVKEVFDLNKGDDAVFRTRNGSPKIMTKFKDKPYSYELLPEYANGSEKFPTVKSMNWEGKTATAKVIREVTSSTPVVERCHSKPSQHITAGYHSQVSPWTSQRRPGSWISSLRQRPHPQMHQAGCQHDTSCCG